MEPIHFQTPFDNKIKQNLVKLKMSNVNPYMNLYQTNLIHVDGSISKEYLFDLAVNLGQVHNLLGVMISDVVKIMGNMSVIQEEKNQLRFKQNNDKSKDFNEQEIKVANHKISMKQNKQKNKIKSNQSIPQKMQIQNIPIDQFNGKIKSDQIIKKEFFFNEFEFNQKKQAKPLKHQPIKNSVFINLFQVNGNGTNKQENQEDLQFSKTISKEKVRYYQKYENQFQGEEVKNHHHKGQAETKDNYEINLKKVQKKDDVKKKTKSPFFDLFDSSQTSSNPLQDQDVLQKFSPINKQKPFDERLYRHTQMNQNFTSSNFLKPKPAGYSSQMENDKTSQPINKYIKPYNLLEETFLVSSPKSNLIQVEEIDDLQSSYKKVSEKREIKMKGQQRSQTIKQNESFDEYIPRRQQIGRKKSNRQTVKGSQCPDCRAFYQAISEDSHSFLDMCECTSRHKSSTTFMKKHQVQNYSQAFSLD